MSNQLSNIFTTEPPTVTQTPEPSSAATPFSVTSQLLIQRTASDSSTMSPTITAPFPMQSKSNRVPTAVGATVGSVAVFTLLIIAVVVILVCTSKRKRNYISRDKGL